MTVIPEMAIAPGGLIRQSIVRDSVKVEHWDTGNTIMFNLQLLNASVFEQVNGIKAPYTPITPKVYKQFGYPFKLYEEKSGIKGSFEGVMSIGELGRRKRVKPSHEGGEIAHFRVVELNTFDEQRPFLPVSEVEAAVKKRNIVADFGGGMVRT
jgi:hypothetical protein